MSAKAVLTGSSGDPRIHLEAPIDSRPPDRRGVWVGIVIAAAVVILVASVLALGLLTARVTTSLPTPIATALSLNVSRDSIGTDSVVSACSAAACNFYNFSVVYAHSNLQLGELVFGVYSPEKTVTIIQGGLVIVGPSGALLGSITMNGGGWTPKGAGNTNLQDRDAVVLYTSRPSPHDLAGYYLVAIGQSSYSSTVSFPIV
ncbi:MAG: hypothetical protein WCB19_02520 [Thermoplasmata archaeon]